MSEENTLIKADFTTHEVFTNPDIVDKIIADVQEKVNEQEDHDATTEAGRKAIKTDAMTIGKTRIFIEGHGKELAAVAKAIPKEIDKGRKRIKDALQVMQDERRRPVTEWEAEQAAIKDANEAKVKSLLAMSAGDPEKNIFPAVQLTAAEIKDRIWEAESLVIDETWGEVKALGEVQREEVLTCLNNTLETKEKEEAERAELEKLRAEAEAKAQAEREERIRAEAAAKAKAEAAAEIERAKMAAEQAKERAEEAEQKAREATEAKPDPKPANPDAKAMNGAYKSLVGYGMSKQEARELVQAIKAGELPNLAIV